MRISACRRLLAPVLLGEWRKPRFTQTNERPVEYAFALTCLGRLSAREVLDVGSGLTAWPHVLADCGFRVTAMDNISDYWDRDVFNRHYHVINDDITSPRLSEHFDAVTCISVLEHVPNHADAVRGIFRLLRPGAHAVLTVPYNENRYVQNVYALEGVGYGRDAAYACQVFSRAQIDEWMTDVGATVVEQEYYRIFSGELWAFGSRVHPPERVGKTETHHLTCVLVKKPE